MPLKAYVIDLAGNRKPIEPANGLDFTLQELHDAIGDGCNCITLHKLHCNHGGGHHRLMVVDDDGYSRGKQTNMLATLLASQFGTFCMAERGIVGNVVICADDQIK